MNVYDKALSFFCRQFHKTPALGHTTTTILAVTQTWELRVLLFALANNLGHTAAQLNAHHEITKACSMLRYLLGDPFSLQCMTRKEISVFTKAATCANVASQHDLNQGIGQWPQVATQQDRRNDDSSQEAASAAAMSAIR